jgi:hypothetical protein
MELNNASANTVADAPANGPNDGTGMLHLTPAIDPVHLLTIQASASSTPTSTPSRAPSRAATQKPSNG